MDETVGAPPQAIRTIHERILLNFLNQKLSISSCAFPAPRCRHAPAIRRAVADLELSAAFILIDLPRFLVYGSVRRLSAQGRDTRTQRG